jgi:hypothetical protein
MGWWPAPGGDVRGGARSAGGAPDAAAAAAAGAFPPAAPVDALPFVAPAFEFAEAPLPELAKASETTHAEDAAARAAARADALAAESDLVPALVRAAAAPRLAALLRCGWVDLASARAADAALRAIEDVAMFLEGAESGGGGSGAGGDVARGAAAEASAAARALASAAARALAAAVADAPVVPVLLPPSDASGAAGSSAPSLAAPALAALARALALAAAGGRLLASALAPHPTEEEAEGGRTLAADVLAQLRGPLLEGRCGAALRALAERVAGAGAGAGAAAEGRALCAALSAALGGDSARLGALGGAGSALGDLAAALLRAEATPGGGAWEAAARALAGP